MASLLILIFTVCYPLLRLKDGKNHPHFTCFMPQNTADSELTGLISRSFHYSAGRVVFNAEFWSATINNLSIPTLS